MISQRIINQLIDNNKPGIKRFVNEALINLGMAHDAIIVLNCIVGGRQTGGV